MKRKGWKALNLFRQILGLGLLALLWTAILRPEAWETVLLRLPKIQFGQILAGVFSQGPRYIIIPFVGMAITAILWGRWFCGFICPLGALMDLMAAIGAKTTKKKYRFRPDSFWRSVVPVVLLISFWAGLTFPLGQLEPYSVIVSGISPVLLILLLIAFFRGRAFCNSICPTGWFLRVLATGSIFGFRLKEETCLGCGACRNVCPSNCVDPDSFSLDRGRCVVCLRCASVCPNGSMVFKGPLKDSSKSKHSKQPKISKQPRISEQPRISKQTNHSNHSTQLNHSNHFRRRTFLRLTSVAIASFGAYFTDQETRLKILPSPQEEPILPPGALSLAHLNAHCTLCHTCVRACPNQALSPAHSGGPSLWAKPLLKPYQGFCQYDCVLCTQVCPTGALVILKPEVKRTTRLGLANLDRPECVVIKNGTSCGACAELCPSGAVRMVIGSSSLPEPVLDQKYCIGCGACQNACPVRPVAAIVVSGLMVQQTAQAPVATETQDAVLEEFPF
ncbi:MAG: 4Fe-4S binding protein [Deltaproteobacteria bacterium]|jgi:polyferredoxin|nr:4Fe-4S binding protein [Deltaproteobacteria bacterium]